jgi:predicted TIM-barrel fold metal-dependent hydrolase
MIGNMVIVDAVVHPWNMSPENQNPAAQAQIDAVYASHKLSYNEANAAFILQPEEFFRDLSFDVIGRAEFAESPVDYAVLHSLPNLGFGLGHITLPEKCAAFREQFPHRCSMLGTVGTPVAATAIDEIKRQIDLYDIDGVKLYPAFFYDGIGEGWRLDGEDWATPFLEFCQKQGLTRVAVHKALWLEPAPRDAFSIDDFESPLSRFPDMTFEMVHGGAAFLDQTIELMKRHRNLYLTLETTFSYVLTRPRVFDKVLGRLITEVGSDRLLFASGNNLAHPLPLIEAFQDYQFAPEHCEEFGVRELTETDRRNIMGENAIDLYGINRDALVAATAADAFAGVRAKGIPGPWSGIRG